MPERSKSAFLELKRRKVHRYVIFRIDDRREEVVVEKTGAPGESYEDFTASLPADDCRYAVYDLDFVSDDNCRKSKIFFISWLVLSFLPLFLVTSVLIQSGSGLCPNRFIFQMIGILIDLVIDRFCPVRFVVQMSRYFD